MYKRYAGKNVLSEIKIIQGKSIYWNKKYNYNRTIFLKDSIKI